MGSLSPQLSIVPVYQTKDIGPLGVMQVKAGGQTGWATQAQWGKRGIGVIHAGWAGCEAVMRMGTETGGPDASTQSEMAAVALRTRPLV